MQLKNNDIKKEITIDDISKIFGNSENKAIFLNLKNFNVKKSTSKKQLDDLILNNWNYQEDKKIIRDMYFKKNKYLSFDEYIKIKDEMISEWNDIFPGEEIKWPFSQGSFDIYIQSQNSQLKNIELSNYVKNKEIDKKICNDVIKYRRIKLLNVVINDYIEKMIIDSNEDIIPTSGNRKSIDFYINGKKYDQKIAKSPTKQFMERYKNEDGGYIGFAKRNPQKVSEFLYEYQDEERFGSNDRLYVVFLEKEKINSNLSNLNKYVSQFKNQEPDSIKFSYNHKANGIKNYKANAYIILI